MGLKFSVLRGFKGENMKIECWDPPRKSIPTESRHPVQRMWRYSQKCVLQSQIWSWSDNRWRSYGDFSPTTQLVAVTLTSYLLSLKLVHGVLVFPRWPLLPSLVFIGLFVFPLGRGMGQTDGRTDGQDQHMMGHPSTKDGPIIMQMISLDIFNPIVLK